MKYTRNESGEVVEVKGCTICPHKTDVSKGNENFMECHGPVLSANAKGDPILKPRQKKLVGNWMGGYHASCPLASDPNQVPNIK